MISTLRKLPWYMAEHITIRQRHAVYKAVMALIIRLKADLRAGKFEEHLTEQLYKRLWTSALLCDGLTVCQKDDVAFIVGLSDETMREFNLPRYANLWTHQWTMAPEPGAPLDVIEVSSSNLSNLAIGLLIPTKVVHCHHPRGDRANPQHVSSQRPGCHPQR